MGGFLDPPSFARKVADLARRLGVLERTGGIPRYSSATRPAASDVEGLFIYNTTTQKHEGSDGTTWNEAY